MNNLCCVLEPRYICSACGMKYCEPCKEAIQKEELEMCWKYGFTPRQYGPAYHEKGKCPGGADYFDILEGDIYVFSKR